jgi:uncharacterized protein
MNNAALYGQQTKTAASFTLNEHKGIPGERQTVRELVEEIAKALVDYPEAVRVIATEGSQVTVLELHTDSRDSGKVIGREGRTAKAIRTLLGSIGMKLHRRFTLDIVSDTGATSSAA